MVTAHIENCRQFSPPTFLAQTQIILEGFLDILGGQPPSNHEKIKSLRALVIDRYGRLERLIQVPICIDKVAQVGELVRYQIAERELLSATITSQVMGS